MPFKSLLFGKSTKKALSTGIVAVLTADEALGDFLELTCKESELEFRKYRSGGQLVKRAGGDELAAVVWDERVEEPDWKGLGRLGEEIPVLVIGDTRAPRQKEGGPVIFNVPEGAAGAQVARALLWLSRSHTAGREAKAAEEKLEETERKFEETSRVSAMLKEHLEFYEQQRNRLSEMVRRTAYLGQLSKEINCLDIEKIVDIAVTKVPKLVDATLASIYFVNEESRELVLKRSNHPYPVVDRVMIDETPQNLMSLAVERKATLLIRNLEDFGAKLSKGLDRSYTKKYKTGSCIVVPLLSGGQVLAVLSFADKSTGEPFDEVRDLPLVDHISQFIGIALRNCQLYQEVRQQARTDGLTGFINHNAFFDELTREIERAKRSRANLSLIILDVDNFKLFNDVHGHQVGDSVLGEVASTIRASVRTVDMAARYGGDEFAIILGDTDLERGELVAERIRRAIAAKAIMIEGRAFSITISAGVTTYSQGQDGSDMVNKADGALYVAKSRGRNAVSTA